RLRVDLSKKKRAGFQMVCADAGDDDHANLIEVAAKRLGIGPHDDCNAFVEELLHARTRLSADAVTGQVDVRQAAANLPDELDAEEPDIAEVDEMADAEDELPDAEAAE